ncbi:MAG: hypothetical protein HRT89_13280 [Lentisphaeria bacterium]|nr:hypothetical protein [Lentisphaeria bacterium]NQZ69030.1 hypothetical protein [Lentisphaeria bacterium]
MRSLVLLLAGLFTAIAGELQPVGVVGNSGVSGASLIPLSESGVPSGLCIDAEKNLWVLLSYRRLSCIDKDGRIIKSFKIPKVKESESDTIKIATLKGKVLVCFQGNNKFFIVDIAAEEASKMQEIKIPFDNPEMKSGLCSGIIKDQFVLFNHKTVYRFDPETLELEDFFTVGVEIDSIGTNFKKYLFIKSGKKTLSYKSSGKSVKTDGAPLDGRLLITYKSILHQQDTDLSAVPFSLKKKGTAVKTTTPQVIYDLLWVDKTKVIASFANGVIRFGTIEKGILSWQKKFAAMEGSLVYLDDKEYIIYNKEHMRLEFYKSGTSAAYKYLKYEAEILSPFLKHKGSLVSIVKGRESFNILFYKDGKTQETKLLSYKIKRLKSFIIYKDSIYLTDDGNNEVLIGTMPEPGKRFISIKKAPWIRSKNTVKKPGAMTLHDDKHMLIEDGGKIKKLEITKSGLREKWAISEWDGDTFGSEVYFSSVGNKILVSDTKKHRILLFSEYVKGKGPKKKSKKKKSRKKAAPVVFVKQFGNTDESGSEKAFNEPGRILSNSEYFYVQDRNNHRIILFQTTAGGGKADSSDAAVDSDISGF